jgi:hypothetical protein
MDDWAYVIEKFWRFIPESIILSLMSPLVFGILDFIWRSLNHEDVLEDEI